MVALITGASSGNGAAFARKLACQGRDLVLVARRQQGLASLSDELHGRFGVDVEVLVTDLTDTIDVERVESRIAELGALDILVNNAGIGIPGTFVETEVGRHLAMIHVHVLAGVRFNPAALPSMLTRGQISIPEALWMSAEKVVEESLDALGQGRVVRVPGFKNRLVIALARAGATHLLLKVLGGRMQLNRG